MCGIFCYYCNLNTPREKIINAALKTQHRGPDETHIINGTCNDHQYHLVFHRLMVNGLSPESGQPLVYPPTAPTCYLMCNGEIYNYKELIKKYGLEDVYDSSSDCEIIIHMYKLVQRGTIASMEDMLLELRGVFAFVILDTEADQLVVGRDPLGVRSMYYTVQKGSFGLCSELKSLYSIVEPESIRQFPGGCYGIYKNDRLQISRYYDVRGSTVIPRTEEGVCYNIQRLLKQAVQRRLMCDRKMADGQPAVGAYLSGGFDSSTIAGLLAKIYPGKLHTFSIGFKDAPDLIAARKVATAIGSEHHELVVTPDEMLEVLKRTPQAIESYDTTTNRASAFMLRLSEYIRDTTDIIVVYSGEGSDELFGSYMYFNNAPDSDSFHQETLRLLHDLQYFDLLRGDKSSAAAGLEIRVPFLDIDFVNYVTTIDPKFKMCHGIEKYILREAVSQLNIIPNEICWRTKEAMSDGVSLESMSWHSIIQKAELELYESYRRYVDLVDLVDLDQDNGHGHGPDPIELEKDMLRKHFRHSYAGCEQTIPYLWLPKWSGDSQDASARTLNVYGQKMKKLEQ